MPERRARGTECGDCAVPVGSPHVDGCDVARCTECGWQRISCGHGDADVGWGAVWTGEWPGDEECRELGWYSRWTIVTEYSRDGRPDSGPTVPCDPDHPDAHYALNRLAAAAAQGVLTWDRERQRWVRANRPNHLPEVTPGIRDARQS
jgi:hypothetical protein